MLETRKIKNINSVNNYNKIKNRDPLTKFPLNMMPYSNSLGVLVGYLYPKMGSMLWAPALMYYGADIYDKYKNDNNEYNPSTKRALRQAIYQGLTNMLFPVIASVIGSQIVTILSMLGNNNLSIKAKEYLIKHHLSYLTHNNDNTNFKNDINKYKDNYNKLLIQSIDDEVRKYNKFMILLRKILIKNDKNLLQYIENKMIHFSNKNIEEIYIIFQQLNSDKIPKNLSKKLYKHYKKLKKTYLEEYKDYNESKNFAIQDVIIETQKNKLYHIKIAKLLTSLSIILLFTKSVNDFVNKKLINNYINPGLNKFYNLQLNTNINKFIKNT